MVCRVGWPRVGGMERAVHELACELRRRGHDVWVLTLDRLRAGEPRLEDGAHEGVPYRRLRGLGPARYPFAVGLRAATEGADLVHVHGLDGLADAAVRVCAPPVGLSTHGGYLHTARQAGLKAAWMRVVTRATFARAGAVWFTSEADRQRFAPAGRDGPVLGNGVDLGRLRPARRTPVPGRIVVLGRIDAHKGHDRLLDLLARVDAPWALDVVGEGPAPLVMALKARAAELGIAARVRWRGALADAAVRELLATSWLAILPSRAEGFGLTLIELMGAGVPVVVGPAPALRERVRCGVDARCLDLVDPGADARHLSAWLVSDPGELVARAEAAASRYGWAEVGARWEQAYRELIGGG